MSTPKKQAEFKSETAIFAGGCFWNIEAEFRKIKGVTKTEVGYSGGTVESPTYEQVCGGDTGHAEAVRVMYDPGRVGYSELLDDFWKLHDPTQLDRQGPDIGRQYRSAIFYLSEKQKNEAEQSKSSLEKSRRFQRPIVTVIKKAGPFYPAEDYHQQYFEKRGTSVPTPELAKADSASLL